MGRQGFRPGEIKESIPSSHDQFGQPEQTRLPVQFLQRVGGDLEQGVGRAEAMPQGRVQELQRVIAPRLVQVAEQGDGQVKRAPVGQMEALIENLGRAERG